MSWKGIKRAAARTPHMMMGNKSNDAIFESLEKEFTYALAAVEKIITESKNFRDSWTKLLTHQFEITTQWTQVYSSIPGENANGRAYYETPQSTLQSIESYSGVLAEIKETILPILNGLDSKVVQPSIDMKKALEQIQKMVKKRHHKKMDYDRFNQSVDRSLEVTDNQVDKLKNKKEKTEKDYAQLQKMEHELEVATQEFQMHDERMKELIPNIVESISSFFGPIMNTMYAVQMDLYQHLYSSVYEYATSQGLSNTENPTDDCLAAFEPIRQRTETEIKSLREGKISRTPMGGPTSKPNLFSRKSSSSSAVSRTSTLKPPPPSVPPMSSPRMDTQRRASGNLGKLPPPPAPVSTPSPSLSPNFANQQTTLRPSVNGSNGRTPSSSSLASVDVKKKKPPPPPPPKPSISPKPEFVVAKYDFSGENEGDLAFAVGSRIKVIKKTDSLEDWWEGEFNGKRGQFPRNYCE